MPVANGNYVVTLKLAEIYFSSAGKRVLDVLIEGTKVVSNLDLFARVGKNAAYDVTVSCARHSMACSTSSSAASEMLPRSVPSGLRHREATPLYNHHRWCD